MRCPYCSGLNGERASFCAHCGRDLVPVQQARQQPGQTQQPQQSPFLPAPHSKPTIQGATRPSSLHQQPPQPPVVPRQPPGVQSPPRMPVSIPQAPQPQQVIEPPVHFPPRTMAQLRELETEAVPYTLVDDTIAAGRKKIVRIVYRRCAAWQQVATLLKAFHEQKQLEAFDTILVQGVLEQDRTPYAFTNGQLQFDRNVRLGSQTLNRYQIETGNGFESDSVRILLEEK